jgi:NAD-dependent dihydropyrimidine dehydrogenase PreA subunit
MSRAPMTRHSPADVLQARVDACPNHRAHARDEPRSYLAWHEWAEKKAKTHDQSECSGCGLFVIWKRKEKSDG